MRHTDTKTNRERIPPPGIKIELPSYASLLPAIQFATAIHPGIIVKEITAHPQEIHYVGKAPIGINQRHMVVTSQAPHPREKKIVVSS